MPAGIQTFNPDGSLEIDYTTRLGLFIGTVQTDAVHGNSTWVGPLPPGDFLFYVVPPPAQPGRTPTVWYSDGRVYWGTDVDGNGQPAFSLVPATVLYGVH